MANITEHENFMFYGQHVATSFGLLKPTKVLMYYKVVKNTFSMMVLNDVESQQSATGLEIIDLDSSDNTFWVAEFMLINLESNINYNYHLCLSYMFHSFYFRCLFI
jgi:hypothetical protein